MRDSTTIRVARSTADELRELATDDAKSISDEVAALVRAERQRRFGRSLAEQGLGDDDRPWLDMAADTVDEHARR